MFMQSLHTNIGVIFHVKIGMSSFCTIYGLDLTYKHNTSVVVKFVIGNIRVTIIHTNKSLIQFVLTFC